MENIEWYDFVDENIPLMQGDFISNCPAISIPEGVIRLEDLEKEDSPGIDIKVYNAIILSQSCDLDNKKIDIVLVCPVWTLDEVANTNQYFKSAEGKEALRMGYLPGYHLLDKCKFASDKDTMYVVEFKNVFGVPYKFITNYAQHIGKRIRLKSPYREHLSQSFARFFMRVGLPSTIQRFVNKPIKVSNIPEDLI